MVVEHDTSNPAAIARSRSTIRFPGDSNAGNDRHRRQPAAQPDDGRHQGSGHEARAHRPSHRPQTRPPLPAAPERPSGSPRSGVPPASACGTRARLLLASTRGLPVRLYPHLRRTGASGHKMAQRKDDPEDLEQILHCFSPGSRAEISDQRSVAVTGHLVWAAADSRRVASAAVLSNKPGRRRPESGYTRPEHYPCRRISR